MSKGTNLPDKRQGDVPQQGKPERDERQSPSDSQSQVESAVRKLAGSEPEKLMEVMALSMTSSANPLYPKMTPEHVSQIIELASKHDERQYDLHKMTTANDHIE